MVGLVGWSDSTSSVNYTYYIVNNEINKGLSIGNSLRGKCYGSFNEVISETGNLNSTSDVPASFTGNVISRLNEYVRLYSSQDGYDYYNWGIDELTGKVIFIKE